MVVLEAAPLTSYDEKQPKRRPPPIVGAYQDAVG